MTYYLSGPMTGYPEFNFPAFEAAAADLRGRGYTVKSAHEVDHGDAPSGSLSWETYLKRDLAVLLTCDAIVLLPGWTASRGSQLERYLAEQLKLPVFMYYPTLERLS